MSTRAENATSVKKQPDLFSDFFTDFIKHPITGDLGKVTGVDSIKQSIRNLLMTEYGEKFYQPNIGSNIKRSLFEPNDIVTEDDLKYSITNTISQNEPRVNLLQVVVQSNQEQRKVSVSIIFSIINTTQAYTLNLILKKVL